MTDFVQIAWWLFFGAVVAPPIAIAATAAIRRDRR